MRNNLRIPEAIRRLVYPLLLLVVAASSLVTAQGVADGTYAVFPDVKPWYTDTGGSGVPVILLHAGTGSSRVWEYQVPVLTKAGFRVIAFDRRGWDAPSARRARHRPPTT